jgi:hypothetical protein
MTTATNKTFKRREWSPQEITQLKQASKKKIPVKKIARTLRRTEGATRQKAFSMGLSMNSTYGNSGRKTGTTGRNMRTANQRRTGTHG